VRSSSPCEDYAAQQKHGKYDASFRGKNYLFAAVVFETTGAINEEGARVLSQLARFAAKRQGREFSSFCGRAWVRFSCNLQRSVSQAILNRLEGSPVEVAASPERFVLELPSSVSVSLVPQVSRQSPPEIPVCPLTLPLSQPGRFLLCVLSPLAPTHPLAHTVHNALTHHTQSPHRLREGSYTSCVLFVLL